MKMKIAVFENEYKSVKNAFEVANLLNFNSELIIKNFASSQAFEFSEIQNYSVIFIDIDLSTQSHLDGFALIQKIVSNFPSLTDRIVILTGNNQINEALKERNIKIKNIKIINKPTDYDELTKIINMIIKADIQH